MKLKYFAITILGLMTTGTIALAQDQQPGAQMPPPASQPSPNNIGTPPTPPAGAPMPSPNTPSSMPTPAPSAAPSTPIESNAAGGEAQTTIIDTGGNLKMVPKESTAATTPTTGATSPGMTRLAPVTPPQQMPMPTPPMPNNQGTPPIMPRPVTPSQAPAPVNPSQVTPSPVNTPAPVQSVPLPPANPAGPQGAASGNAFALEPAVNGNNEGA